MTRAVRASLRGHLPPLALARRGPIRHDWTERDRLILLGLQELEDSIHACGQPTFESFAPAGEGPEYEADDGLCRACARLEVAHEANQSEGATVEKGAQIFLHVHRRD